MMAAAAPSTPVPSTPVPSAARDRAGSPERFGWEWGACSELLPIREEQFRRWTPPWVNEMSLAAVGTRPGES